ncbi:MAG: phytanoyl-CoA dioxygenase family protein [Pirellulales bacterium]
MNAINQQSLALEYGQNGYCFIPHLFSNHEVSSWQQECERIWSNPDLSSVEAFRVDQRKSLGEKARRERVDPVTDISPIFAQLAKDKRLLALAELLLGEKPLVFKDKLIVKEPDTLGYELHQDFAYISHLGFPGNKQLVIIVAIDPCTSSNGAIEVVPGLHNQLVPGTDPDTGIISRELLDTGVRDLIEMQPGDVLIMSSLCPHSSGPNLSQNNRRILFFTYNGQSCGDLYDTYYDQGKP